MDSYSTVPTPCKASVDGVALTHFPEDLFIPPDALEVLLDSFTGPLDLLLYLIRKQDIDILNIPMMRITEQYLQYIQWMEHRKLELASDYLLMAAVLSEIKARLLLPIFSNTDEEEEDPRMTLVRQLQAYEQIKHAAEKMDLMPRQERDYFVIQSVTPTLQTIKMHPDVALIDLMEAMQSLLRKQEHQAQHQISRETLSVRERMSLILSTLQECHVIEFSQLLKPKEGRMGLIVTLLALLELAKQSLLILIQVQAFSPIQIQAIHHDG